MLLAGLHPMSLIDFPGKIAATVFTQGCNMRCPYCHNRELLPMAPPMTGQSIAPERFFHFLDARRRRLDGVCVTGGEPTQHPDLPDFLREIRAHGFLVKLDTNGSRPAVLEEILSAGLVDFIAMDIKHRLEPGCYDGCCGVRLPVEQLRKSVRVIQHGAVPYEFRTTVAPGLMDAADLLAIADSIAGARRYALQAFQPHDYLPAALNARAAESPALIREVEEAVRSRVDALVIRE